MKRKSKICFHHEEKYFQTFEKKGNFQTFTKSEKVKNSIKKLLENFDLDADKDLCGFMIETFQGWGAIYDPKEYLKLLSQICKSNDILISFDEISLLSTVLLFCDSCFSFSFFSSISLSLIFDLIIVCIDESDFNEDVHKLKTLDLFDLKLLICETLFANIFFII